MQGDSSTFYTNIHSIWLGANGAMVVQHRDLKLSFMCLISADCQILRLSQALFFSVLEQVYAAYILT